MSKLYIGTKVVHALPMIRASYNKYRGWELPADENGYDDGYLVEYIDGGQANHPDHKGYISWSPAEVFNRAYRLADKMTFGQAIDAMKAGQAVARAGWNGKGMQIYLTHGARDRERITQGGTDAGADLNGINPSLFSDGVAGIATRLPRIDMLTASGAILNGWLASQTDMLAEDWTIVTTQ
ncbi:MAG: DUF2829 domain-containing protein, partial [Hyphomicrobiaceae bacterium]